MCRKGDDRKTRLPAIAGGLPLAGNSKFSRSFAASYDIHKAIDLAVRRAGEDTAISVADVAVVLQSERADLQVTPELVKAIEDAAREAKVHLTQC